MTYVGVGWANIPQSGLAGRRIVRKVTVAGDEAHSASKGEEKTGDEHFVLFLVVKLAECGNWLETFYGVE